MKRISWTQPQCAGCWTKDNPDRPLVQMLEAEQEICVTCGRATSTGIYIRISPAIAPFPTLTKD